MSLLERLPYLKNIVPVIPLTLWIVQHNPALGSVIAPENTHNPALNLVIVPDNPALGFEPINRGHEPTSNPESGFELQMIVNPMKMLLQVELAIATPVISLNKFLINKQN